MYVGGVVMGSQLTPHATSKTRSMARDSFSIDRVRANFERELLKHPFAFKGGTINQLRQVATQIISSSGKKNIGLGVQSPLWSDAAVAGKWGNTGSNALMYCMTERTRLILEGKSYSSPIAMTGNILNEVHEYGKRITENNNLNQNFALNALTPIDFAAWLTFAEQNEIRSFDALIPPEYREAFPYRHKKITNLPTISYNTPASKIKSLPQKGYFLIKIHIGSPGNTSTMLQRDMEAIKLIHETIGHIKTPYTQGGKINYTFDANGRYTSKEELVKLLDYCQKIGAKDQILLVEEPFDEALNIDVSAFDTIIAADESVHTAEDAKKLGELGYRAFALKPIPKTLSKTFKIADVAYQNNIACFVADLTVNPVLTEWNKNIAARLPPLPGLKTGVMESNGHQNYLHWEMMKTYLPIKDASWDRATNGFFELTKEFYEKSGGIFLPSAHYQGLFQ